MLAICCEERHMQSAGFCCWRCERGVGWNNMYSFESVGKLVNVYSMSKSVNMSVRYFPG